MWTKTSNVVLNGDRATKLWHGECRWWKCERRPEHTLKPDRPSHSLYMLVPVILILQAKMRAVSSPSKVRDRAPAIKRFSQIFIAYKILNFFI